DDVADRKAKVLRFIDVDIDVASRIHDRRLSFGSDEVRGLRETPKVELLEGERGHRHGRGQGIGGLTGHQGKTHHKSSPDNSGQPHLDNVIVCYYTMDVKRRETMWAGKTIHPLLEAMLALK